jgi:hypothetical protein
VVASTLREMVYQAAGICLRRHGLGIPHCMHTLTVGASLIQARQ